MDFTSALIAAAVTVVTAVLGYLRFRDESKIKLHSMDIGGLKERIAVLEAGLKACEEHRITDAAERQQLVDLLKDLSARQALRLYTPPEPDPHGAA